MPRLEAEYFKNEIIKLLDQGITKKYVAEKCGVAPSSIGRIVSGKTKTLNEELADKLKINLPLISQSKKKLSSRVGKLLEDLLDVLSIEFPLLDKNELYSELTSNIKEKRKI